MSDHPIRIHPVAIKGRGTTSRTPSRFDTDAREAVDDGWSGAEPVGEAGEAGEVDDTWAPAPLGTEVRFEDAKRVLSRNESPDIPFDRSINPYRGCEHGCVYCFARPTHSYLGLSPGLDFETIIIAKRNVAAALRAELAQRDYTPGQLAIGTATDCYQPVERDLRLTRSVIEVLKEARHPFGLVTKSSAVEHDLDLIAPMAADRLAAVYLTITTLDPKLSRILEPRAASPARRLQTIRNLVAAGVPVGVSLAPQIPFVNEDMEQVMAAAWEAGARSAFYTVLRLPWELTEVFREWLEVHYPQRAGRIMGRIQDMRGGKDYDSDFGSRMTGEGIWADLIRQRFLKAAARLGFNRERIALDFSQFRPPSRDVRQASLF
jgi:DNA repair photolyase